MKIDDQIRVFERFNEKVDRLNQRGFAEESEGSGSIVEWRRGQGWDGIHVGPSAKTVEATVLTLRFFLIDNESTSLSNMEDLYSDLNIGPDLARRFRDVRSQVNAYLDSLSNLSISEEGPMTHRQILYLFIYGDLAHANDVTKEANFRSVRQTGFFPLFQADFTQTVQVILSVLNEIQQINREALVQLRSGHKP